MTAGTQGGDPGPGRRRQAEIFLRGLAKARPAVPVSAERLEARARETMSREAWAYVAGGAGMERTLSANRQAFDSWRLVPRVLRDVSARDLTVELFGGRLPSPLLLAPIGVLEMAHREADMAVARAAAVEGIPFIFSSQASVPLEECVAVMGDSPRWFQLYWGESDDVVASFIRRAEACGCEALVITLDTTLLGWRPRDLDLAYLPFLRGMGIAQYTSDPAFREALSDHDEMPSGPGRPPLRPASVRAAWEMIRRYPGGLREKLRTGEPRAAVRRFIATYSRPSLAWENLGELRDMTRLPILLKGILHPDDAKRAVEAGMDGVVVSNHGGRQVDGAVAALDALPAVADAAAGRIKVLFDSGIRSGADAVKALALGADAVCLGRPYVYGLALAGEAGVREVIRNVVAELDLTLGLVGRTSCRDLDRGALAPAGPSSALERSPAT